MNKALTIATILSMVSISQTVSAEEYTVKMVTDYEEGKYYFEPQEISIQSGDTITWVNVQDDMHNAVADSSPIGAERFESPMLEEENQKWSYTFEISGSYSYHCHPHAAMGMVGSVIVDRPSEPEEIEKGTDGHDHEHGDEKMDMKAMDHSKTDMGGEPRLNGDGHENHDHSK